MKQLKVLQILLIFFFSLLINDISGMQRADQDTSEMNRENAVPLVVRAQVEPVQEDSQHGSPLTNTTTNTLQAIVINDNDIPPNRGRNFEPFLRSIGVDSNIDKMVESCKYLEGLLSTDQIAEADMEIFSLNSKRKTGLFDWVTRGWGLATWFVGTAQNFATVSVVVCSILANVFPDEAITIATASGVIAALGAIFSKMYSYCKEKKLKRMAYNLIIMCGQSNSRTVNEGLISNVDNESVPMNVGA